MCHHVIKIKHRNGQSTLREVEDDTLATTIEDIKALPETVGYEIFSITARVSQAMVWETQTFTD